MRTVPAMLATLSLARSGLDRAAHRRDEAGLVGTLLNRPTTRVLVLIGDQAVVTTDDAAPALVLRPGPELAHLGDRLGDAGAGAAGGTAGVMVGDGAGDPAAASPLTAYLGTDAAGHDHVLIALPPGGRSAEDASPPADGTSRLAVLREVGAGLDDTDAGLFTCALALANWHATHPRCSRCGAPTRVAAAGWTRRCPACATDHFPRTDPAVIMSVVDEQDRLLLGHQAVWPDKRFSTLAGFVEPGESLEAAVRREVGEEVGLEVGEVAYQGSQPWPFPSSLMLAFRARALTTQIRVDGDELEQARWWSREELALDVATGELLLPPPLSVSRSLIEQWFGGPIRDAGASWR